MATPKGKAVCDLCADDFDPDKGLLGACREGHDWCVECFTNAVQTAIQHFSDASCMPPRCCGEPILPLAPPKAPQDAVGEAHSNDPVANGHANEALSLLSPGLRTAWEAARQKAYVLRSEGDPLDIDPSVVRMAMRYRGPNLYQFCSRCKRLTARSNGCNHMKCICGHDFCLICGGDWFVPGSTEVSTQCHQIYGDSRKHVLKIPPEIQRQVNPKNLEIPAAYVDEDATGILCHHEAHLLYKLRLRREPLRDGIPLKAPCHICGRCFGEFLLECTGCQTLMCLKCRDSLWAARAGDRMASPERVRANT
ncbi:hypothetical protein VTJ83DRAFT_2345 [Remersonia thermophila]|uniref:RING-type domain-containing protein n=1 Tax=Remersonia thermophila TaxID=72144 RepID=A0ABR4DIQ1_9PEZI